MFLLYVDLIVLLTFSMKRNRHESRPMYTGLKPKPAWPFETMALVPAARTSYDYQCLLFYTMLIQNQED